jgi:hypothetical protein
MQVPVEVPKAFSLRDENEFFPLQHLMARLNPDLMVKQITTGKHIHSGCTVHWGLVYLDGQELTEEETAAALEEAGFDFTKSSSLHALA